MTSPSGGPAQPSSLEIARAARLRPIAEVAEEAGLGREEDGLFVRYGAHVAKVSPRAAEVLADRPPARLVLVTALTPTPLGEGKTTTAVGLAQGLARRGRRAVLTLRQPSMGPTFGIKGGAAGAGRSQVVPMETLNLHLTGDFHAITAAHNLLAAMVDNHLHHGNELDLDVRSISWRRVLDTNDRALRNVVVGLGDRVDGVPRQSGFDITAASEVGVALALCRDLHDLRARLGRLVVGFTTGGEPVTAEQLRAAGAMTVMLKDAVSPNLLQTIEGTPVLVHAGPFGNIATGNSSVVADLVGSRMGDYLITEAGFGSDMGAERFVNLKTRISGLAPSAAVLVASVRTLKAHSGRHKVAAGKPLPDSMLEESPDDVLAGAANLRRHVEIVRSFGIPVVVAVNAFTTDHPSELDAVAQVATEAGARVAVSTHVRDGGAGAEALATEVEAACADGPVELHRSYDLTDALETKLERVVTQVYGGAGVALSPVARRELERFTALGFGELPVVIAKTHLSISHDPTLKGDPRDFTVPVREVRLAAGAGYVYAIAGEMRTMPGLGRRPAAEQIDIDADGNVVGLF